VVLLAVAVLFDVSPPSSSSSSPSMKHADDAINASSDKNLNLFDMALLREARRREFDALAHGGFTPSFACIPG
jgi:hypothetical protein